VCLRVACWSVVPFRTTCGCQRVALTRSCREKHSLRNVWRVTCWPSHPFILQLFRICYVFYHASDNGARIDSLRNVWRASRWCSGASCRRPIFGHPLGMACGDAFWANAIMISSKASACGTTLERNSTSAFVFPHACRNKTSVVLNSALAPWLAPAIFDVVCACFPLRGREHRMSFRSWSVPSCYVTLSRPPAACSCRAPWCIDYGGSRAGGLSTTKLHFQRSTRTRLQVLVFSFQYISNTAAGAFVRGLLACGFAH